MTSLFELLKNIFERRFSGGEEQETPLCVMNDKVFKKMLSSDTEDSREALRHLLSACTRREVTAVKVLNSEILPAYIGGKSSLLDVRVNFNNGEAADIEMQIEKSSDDLKNRAAQYSAALQFSQAKKGVRYKNIRRVYQIFFLNHILFPGDKLPRRYGYREETEHDLLTESTEIIFYEMPKLERRVRDYFTGRIGVENLSDEEKWCIFFKYHHEQQAQALIKELCRKEEGIMRAEKQVEKLPRSYIRFMTTGLDRYRAQLDLMDRLNAAHAEGLEEGQLKGRNEGHDDVFALLAHKLSSAEIEEIKSRLANK